MSEVTRNYGSAVGRIGFSLDLDFSVYTYVRSRYRLFE